MAGAWADSRQPISSSDRKVSSGKHLVSFLRGAVSTCLAPCHQPDRGCAAASPGAGQGAGRRNQAQDRDLPALSWVPADQAPRKGRLFQGHHHPSSQVWLPSPGRFHRPLPSRVAP